MTTVLVIGDTGLLGQALVRVASVSGLVVRGASRHSPDLSVDALDDQALARLMQTVQPDVVINAAALVDLGGCDADPGRAYCLNGRLPGVLAGLCAAAGCRFVQISTDHYYSGDGTRAHDESAPVTLCNEYARSKYVGESLAAVYERSLIVRTNIVGFRGWEKPSFVEWLCGALQTGEPIRLFTDYYTSSIAVDQFAEVLFRLLRHPVSGVINLAARDGASKHAFAHALAKACGLSVAACSEGRVTDLPGAPRAESLVLDVSKAEKILGAPLPTLSDVVESLANTYHIRQRP